MATGLARGANARGKRIALGDGNRIIWGPRSKEVFSGNPNIAPPGAERAPDIEWINYYKGHRLYHIRVEPTRWVFNYEFRVKPGELFFLQPAAREPDLIVIEPNCAVRKSSAINRDCPPDRFQHAADKLRSSGFRVVQAVYPDAVHRLANVELIEATFNGVAQLLKRARLYIGPHGGLSHVAAAVATPAVVIFGGWAPPEVLGYDFHENLTGGAQACGSIVPCEHCRAAMHAITPTDVIDATMRLLDANANTAAA